MIGNSKVNIGKCALCGKVCKLTFEHIPPRAAFNSKPIKPVSGEEFFKESNLNKIPWETTGMKYSNQQKGMGLYSLCSDCNNNTGSFYGDAYNEFAYKAAYMFRNLEESNTMVDFYKIFPLRIIKQICSMFCSINADISILDDIREFVLDKESTVFNKSKYRIQMYFNNGNIIKYNGFTCLLKYSGSIMELSEIVAPPFGFQLILNPQKNQKYTGINITDFVDCNYNSLASIAMPIDINEVNNIIPNDYRTKSEIITQMAEAEKYLKDYQ